jgi:hypothetical protein
MLFSLKQRVPLEFLNVKIGWASKRGDEAARATSINRRS